MAFALECIGRGMPLVSIFRIGFIMENGAKCAVSRVSLSGVHKISSAKLQVFFIPIFFKNHRHALKLIIDVTWDYSIYTVQLYTRVLVCSS